jgi:flagellar assembly protein FliH
MSVAWSEEHRASARRWATPVFDVARVAGPDPAEQIARLAALEAEAQARGFAAGRAAGLAEGRALVDELAGRLKALCAALATPLTVVDAETERLLVALTLESARRIAQQELHLEPARVAAVVRDAVAALGTATRGLSIYVNPDDYAALTTALAGELSGPEGWRLVADPETLPGGCRVESSEASVVSSLDARAAGLAHGLLVAP